MPESSFDAATWSPGPGGSGTWPEALAGTLDPSRRSFVESANAPDADFPIRNLPFGAFSTDTLEPRLGVAIGDRALDLRNVVEAGLLEGLDGRIRCALSAASLDDLLALGRPAWLAARVAISRLLDADHAALRDRADRETFLPAIEDIRLGLPARTRDYTDFYASEHHATNVGRMFRPDNPLMPNWKHLPVGYHGRASSLVPSGTPIRRPHGQTVGPDGPPPAYGPVRLLDYEIEVGFLIGPGNRLGDPIPASRALDHVFGLAIVNDWSARDVQKWEYQPLGPFNAKNFATSISPWVVTLEALAPFMVDGPPRAAGDPENLPYLRHDRDIAIDLELEVAIASKTMRDAGTPATRVSLGNYREMYWSIAQMVAHHTSTGCNLQPGDLMASGTVSGPEESNRGCLLERTWRGENPVELADGTSRRFLQDGDEVVMRGWCGRGERRIGFGACTGIVDPAT
ncbi:MAG: fumarylacetoacetase [Phycisphaerales bacterium]|jgi:fumarylacetoacetase